MRPLAKVGLIVAGYLLACLAAFAVVAVHVAATSSSDNQGSSGMYAFGDSLLFLAVFAVAAVPSTAAALYLLRSYRSFWFVLCGVALCIATTAVVALVDYGATRTAGTSSMLGSWSVLAVLRILVAPLFALGFLVCGLFAPDRAFRVALFIATAIETAVLASGALILFLPFRSY